MQTKVLDLEHLLNADSEAKHIASKWEEWNSYRRGWVMEKRELRNYVYATDTRTTTNSKLPWSNSTTTPKLTQIYDNLKANYTAAIFPQEKFMKWIADDEDSDAKTKRDVIQAYMENKVRHSQFRKEVDKLIDDYVLTGNCFGTVDFVNNTVELDTGEIVAKYIGPQLVRISPYDIAFDPTATDFSHTPKILRTIKTLGDVAKMAETNEHYDKVFKRMLENRSAIGNSTGHQIEKADGYIADGFSSIDHYYSSSYVEFLTFYGDLFDIESGTLHSNRIITIVDRSYIMSNESNPSWLGSDPIFHAGWRTRPDNLYAMGPLDNLVGMQYRIDHLENLKADIFDQIALPALKVKGDVEDFDFEPGVRIYLGEEGDVMPLVPDTTALNADLQIQNLENKMEELAGAPRMAMGLRTPGEKTAFEVDVLSNAANRIFNHKAAQFEIQFLEPILNAMLESARRNMNFTDTISVLDADLGVQVFQTITKDDLTAQGKIVPQGARHFSEKARRVQGITQLVQLKASDPSIAPHISGKETARILSEEIGEPTLYTENVGVQENANTQTAALDAEADLMEEQEIKAEQGL